MHDGKTTRTPRPIFCPRLAQWTNWRYAVRRYWLKQKVCIPWDIKFLFHADIDGLVQNCSNSSALALELLQCCTKPSICPTLNYDNNKSPHWTVKSSPFVATILKHIVSKFFKSPTASSTTKNALFPPSSDIPDQSVHPCSNLFSRKRVLFFQWWHEFAKSRKWGPFEVQVREIRKRGKYFACTCCFRHRISQHNCIFYA